MRVCVVTFPIDKAGVIPLSHIIDILGSLSTDIYLITGNAGYLLFKGNENIHTLGVEHKTRANILMRIISYVSTQLKISYELLKIISDTDICYFFLGGEGLLLPMLIARLWRRNVVLNLAGFPDRGSKVERDPSLI
jgi:hypothetical protein